MAAALTIGKTSTDEGQLTLSLTGKLDTMTSLQLEAELKKCLDTVKHLVFDFSALDYVSSAGLRVLVKAQKVMNKQGTMVVRNPNSEIYEILDVTGLAGILTIETDK